MAKKKKMQHPVFGELECAVSDLWQRDIEIPISGRSVTITLSVQIDEKEGLEPQQIRAFEQFRDRQVEFLRNAERKMFEYYRSVCEEYRDRLDVTDPHDKCVPKSPTLDVFRTLVTPTEVIFPYAASRATFGLLCDCTWEREHGLGVRFEEGRVSEVGYQDVVL